MFLQKVSLAFIAGWLLNQALCERHRRYSYVLPPPTLSSHELFAYEPYQAGYAENSIEPSTERQVFDEDEEEVPPSPYSPPPMDDSADEDFGESETEAPPTTTTAEPTTEPTTTRESIRKKRKQLKRKLSALTGAKFRDKIQRRSSGKPRKKVTYESAESYAGRPPAVVGETSTFNNAPVPTRVAHFMPQNQAHVPQMPPPVRGPLSLPPVGSRSHNALMSDHWQGPPSLVSSQVLGAPPLGLSQVHTTPAPTPPPLSPPNHFPHSMIVSQFHSPDRSPDPATAFHGSVPARNHFSSAFMTPQGPSSPIADTHDFQQLQYHAAPHVLPSAGFHPQYSALHPLAFAWAQPVPIINFTQQPVTTASPLRRPSKRPSSKPTERIRSYFRKRSYYPRSNDGIIKGHAHDHISFKKTFHMTLFKIPFLSIDVAKKVYKDESLIADLGKRTGESYNHAHG